MGGEIERDECYAYRGVKGCDGVYDRLDFGEGATCEEDVGGEVGERESAFWAPRPPGEGPVIRTKEMLVRVLLIGMFE